MSKMIRLTVEVPSNANYIVYFNNYDTSVPLIAAFYQKEILSVGTGRYNKTPNCKLPNKNFFKNKFVVHLMNT